MSSVKNCIAILSEHINYTIEYAFTVIDCLMNQINGIAERSVVAFYSAVHIKVSV